MTVQNYIFSVFLGIYSDHKIRIHSKIETLLKNKKPLKISTVFYFLKEFLFDNVNSFLLQKGRDSNPRYRYQYTTFPR